jgi:hypothetical protein
MARSVKAAFENACEIELEILFILCQLMDWKPTVLEDRIDRGSLEVCDFLHSKIWKFVIMSFQYSSPSNGFLVIHRERIPHERLKSAESHEFNHNLVVE